MYRSVDHIKTQTVITFSGIAVYGSTILSENVRPFGNHTNNQSLHFRIYWCDVPEKLKLNSIRTMSGNVLYFR